MSESEVEFDGQVLDPAAIVKGVQEFRDALVVRRDIRASSWLHDDGGLTDLSEQTHALLDLAQITRDVALVDLATGMAAHEDEVEMLAQVEKSYGFGVDGP